MKNKIKYILPVVCIAICVFTTACFAVTDAEVQAAVDANGKESVSGNLFVWFLCAIAFMKVSQKIDSFMSSLGISVGRTGGSMMGEAMIAARAVSGMVKGGAAGFKGGSSGGNTQTGGKPAGVGGIFGGIGRKVTGGAVDSVTGGTSGGNGIMSNIGKKAYENSVGKGGSFATSVISSVARGEINRMGTISGTNGKTAMESYFGYTASMNRQSEQSSSISRNSKSTLEHGGSSTILSKSEQSSKSGMDVSGTITSQVSGDGTGGGRGADGVDNSLSSGVDMTSMNSAGETTIPTFTDIEMGGGRITGMESSIEYPEPRAFAMYDAEKYAKPEGNFETVTAVDNSKWYKQYAAPAVERTPYMDNEGKVQYNEKIVDKMPKAPMRKDRM